MKTINNDVTVSIMNFNYGMFAAQAIDSVLSQTVLPGKILFVDDCSKEDDIGCKIAEKYGIEVIKREKNMGIVNNFNDVLFNHVKTKKLMLLGADNYISPLYIEKLGGEDADIASCDITLVGNAVDKIRESKKSEWKDGYWIWKFTSTNEKLPLKRRILRNNFIHGSSIYNVELAKSVGGYEAKIGKKHTEEDHVLWQKMISKDASHKHIPEPLLYYRRSEFNFNGIY